MGTEAPKPCTPGCVLWAVPVGKGGKNWCEGQPRLQSCADRTGFLSPLCSESVGDQKHRVFKASLRELSSEQGLLDA